jgi:putative flippase GtrA
MQQSVGKLRRAIKRGAVIPYVLEGTLVFWIGYLLFFICYRLLHIELAVATAVSYIVGLGTNFILIRYWVFAEQALEDYLHVGILKYGFFLAINFGITYVMLKFLQEWLGISPFIGNFIVAFFMTGWNYLNYRLWVFKGPSAHRSRFGL